MGARIESATIVGIEAHPVQVETEVIGSLRRFAIVGLPDGVLREAKDRVRCALESSGFTFPHGEVIVNLAPAALPKRGSGFDLAIALSILIASGQIPPASLRGCIAYAELNLDGGLKPVGGELAVAVRCAELGRKAILCSELGADSAACVEEVRSYGAAHLSSVVAHLRGLTMLEPYPVSRISSSDSESYPILDDVVGQEHAKRALEVTAAGGHNLLLVGPPGSGKSMLAQRLPSLLPPLPLQQSVEVASIHSVAQHLRPRNALSARPPFRAPHHSTSVAGLVGGGSIPRPGEITLAHRGVLFLDEIAELRRDAIEALRMPLETRTITISRSQMQMEFPADCIVVAAMNPCPCGKYGVNSYACRCTEQQRKRYFERLSGPVRDRFDIQLWVPPVPIEKLQSVSNSEPHTLRLRRIAQARTVQSERGVLNAKLHGELLQHHCVLDDGSKKLIERASKRYSLSARGYTRILRVGRTIADLAGSQELSMEHIAEALAFRNTSIDT